MMGGSAGGTSGNPGTGQVFLPPNQPEAASQWWNLANPLFGAAANGGASTPAGQNYPWAQNFVDRFLTGNNANGPTPFNDLATRAFNPAYAASDYGSNVLFPRGQEYATALGGAGNQALAQGFDPAYQQLVAYTQANPYFPQALEGAQQGRRMGAAGADQMFGSANQITQAGFDPRSALFNRSRQQLMDQTNATNAMSGLAGTPYGASVAANALGNFDMNWQNQQLARQTQAGAAAGNLYGAAPSLAATSGAMPTMVEQQQLHDVAQMLGLRNQAASMGATTAGNLFQGAQGLGGQAANLAMQLGAAPYNLGAGMTTNALQGLSQANNLGYQQYRLPMDLMGSLSQYMGLGQNASQLAGALQNQGFNQTSSGIGGLFSGLGTLGSLAMMPFGAPPAGSAAASI